MEDKLFILHENLIKNGYDLPDYDTFKADMLDPVKSNKLHTNLVGEGFELPDYDTFLGDMNLKKKRTILTRLGFTGSGLGFRVSYRSITNAIRRAYNSTITITPGR